jgi:hypothetical protein
MKETAGYCNLTYGKGVFAMFSVAIFGRGWFQDYPQGS